MKCKLIALFFVFISQLSSANSASCNHSLGNLELGSFGSEEQIAFIKKNVIGSYCQYAEISWNYHLTTSVQERLLVIDFENGHMLRASFQNNDLSLESWYGFSKTDFKLLDGDISLPNYQTYSSSYSVDNELKPNSLPQKILQALSDFVS